MTTTNSQVMTGVKFSNTAERAAVLTALDFAERMATSTKSKAKFAALRDKVASVEGSLTINLRMLKLVRRALTKLVDATGSGFDATTAALVITLTARVDARCEYRSEMVTA